jgi:hypothetical protein
MISLERELEHTQRCGGGGGRGRRVVGHAAAGSAALPSTARPAHRKRPPAPHTTLIPPPPHCRQLRSSEKRADDAAFSYRTSRMAGAGLEDDTYSAWD